MVTRFVTRFNESKEVRLPESFRPFFWSYDFEKLDPDDNKKTIIIQVINYGDMKQWAWLSRYYGLDMIKEILSSLPINEIKPRTRELT